MYTCKSKLSLVSTDIIKWEISYLNETSWDISSTSFEYLWNYLIHCSKSIRQQLNWIWWRFWFCAFFWKLPLIAGFTRHFGGFFMNGAAFPDFSNVFFYQSKDPHGFSQVFHVDHQRFTAFRIFSSIIS